jgi:hypothetical protein
MLLRFETLGVRFLIVTHPATRLSGYQLWLILPLFERMRLCALISASQSLNQTHSIQLSVSSKLETSFALLVSDPCDKSLKLLQDCKTAGMLVIIEMFLEAFKRCGPLL